MRKAKFKYPPCIQHPLTERIYPSHAWEIVQNRLIKKTLGTQSIYYYKVRCKHCGINDPNPPLH